MSVYFAPIGTGLGDVIVGLPVIRWLVQEQNEPVFLVERGPRQQGLGPHIHGLAGTVREIDLSIGPGDRLVNMRNHPLVHSWNWGSEKFAREFPDWHINDIQRVICHQLQIFPDFDHLQPLTCTPCPDTHGKVLLIPGTTGDFKAWPEQMWLELARQLHSEQIETLVIGEPERSEVVSHLVASGLAHYPTEQISSAIDAVSSARLTIAVDTGLMHVAVQQSVPTVALMNYLNLYLRPCANCRPIMSPICQPQCIPDFGDHPTWPINFSNWVWLDTGYYRCRAPGDLHCMSAISAKSVADCALSMLLPTNAP